MHDRAVHERRRHRPAAFSAGRADSITTARLSRCRASRRSLSKYADSLPGTFVGDPLRQKLTLALTAIIDGADASASTTYTNIHLMAATVLIVVGEFLADHAGAEGSGAYAAFIQRGYSMLDDWIVLTGTEGIIELDSPTYYATDLDSLVIGLLSAHHPDAFQTILEYVWSDVAASFFPAAGTLSGAHSRNYDFLRGSGAVEMYTYLAGWRGIPDDYTPFEPAIEDVFAAWNFAQDGGFRVASSSCGAAFALPKEVTSLWGKDNGQDRTTYVSAHAALGSVSSDYTSADQEKILSAELPSPATVISLVTSDDSADPYGLQKIAIGQFKKTFRLASHPAAVQSHNWVLATSYAAPSTSNKGTTLLTTNILLPVTADI